MSSQSLRTIFLYRGIAIRVPCRPKKEGSEALIASLLDNFEDSIKYVPHPLPHHPVCPLFDSLMSDKVGKLENTTLFFIAFDTQADSGPHYVHSGCLDLLGDYLDFRPWLLSVANRPVYITHLLAEERAGTLLISVLDDHQGRRAEMMAWLLPPLDEEVHCPTWEIVDLLRDRLV
ncbi:MAG: hypothetical protein Q9215_006825 [Flavoplaca cf. flavocitrina]